MITVNYLYFLLKKCNCSVGNILRVDYNATKENETFEGLTVK